jgi:TRAP-type mannitol/chloroaromatic compound transport system substrate-binding protein
MPRGLRCTASSASPGIVLAGGEIVPALERGAIDGAEWINCYDDKILGLDKVPKFHYAPGMHKPVTVGEFIIKKAKWDALPADLKEIVKTSVQAS